MSSTHVSLRLSSDAWTRYSAEAQAILVAQIARNQSLLYGGTEDYLVTREFKAIKSKLLDSLTNRGQPFISVDVHVDRVTPAVRNRVRQTLTEIDRSAPLFVVANFLQAVYTGDEHSTSGHFARGRSRHSSRGRGCRYGR